MSDGWSNKTRDVVEAIAHYVEKREVLSRRMDEYDGHSPSWALANEIGARDDAEKAVGAALDKFVNDAIGRYLENLGGPNP